MISIDETEKILDELAQELPSEFYRELNGGIILLPDTKLHHKSVDNDLYILGEYHRNISMGRYIVIYYGSYSRVYGYMNKEQLKIKLRETVRHEFTHHMESLAGERSLEIKDAHRISGYLRRKAKHNNHNA